MEVHRCSSLSAVHFETFITFWRLKIKPLIFGDTSLSGVWGKLLCEVYEMKIISTSLTDVHNDPIPDLLKLSQLTALLRLQLELVL